MRYTHLNTTTNFTFLTGASHPKEYVQRAAELGYSALAITDECSLAGAVKAYVAAKKLALKLIIGSHFTLSNGMQLIAIAPSRTAYAELSGFITLARRRAPKGRYEAHLDDLRFRLQHCLIIWQVNSKVKKPESMVKALYNAFKQRLWLGINHQLAAGEQHAYQRWQNISQSLDIPLVASGDALMHDKSRKPLQDVLTAIKENTPVTKLGTRLQGNGEAYLKSREDLTGLYPALLLEETNIIADMCDFSLDELRYQYPQELVPTTMTPIAYLRSLVDIGKKKRWPHGVPAYVEPLLDKELQLIEELQYEYYFLTVYDIVRFAREQNILCQGRGSAANSVVCYCLMITEIAPGQINVLFERFISKERDEAPDIDVDFEHQRREEVIQYIYRKYGRERAALAATIITYRSRSAIRDVGKALGMEANLVDHLACSLTRWDSSKDLRARINTSGLQTQQTLLLQFFSLVEQIIGFPRHLSQHVGGFVICQDKVSNLVPLENASMPERTIIQWDKEDLESMRLLKVDVLSLGMLTALRKALAYINRYDASIQSLADIPREDAATYTMLCAGDTVGIFQIESRAQMSMLPRLQPRCFYDLVIQIAIVRPGPIQGDMVHPYLRRRNGSEPIHYLNPVIENVLKPTLGVPIFQEQVIRLSMVAAGFSGGEADELRRAITNWGKNSELLLFEQKFIRGMQKNNYPLDFSQRLFEQIKGFGGYGFPESHSASFALLCYVSSWLKCHHPAAFYCALLNSQPMGFYSPSQLVQDAKRHRIKVRPVDINCSRYDNCLEPIASKSSHPNRQLGSASQWAIRLGFCQVKNLNREKAKTIEHWRQNQLFDSLHDLARRTCLSKTDLQCLASADALHSISGNRHQSHWQAAAVEPATKLFPRIEPSQHDDLLTPKPHEVKDVIDDYSTTGLSLRSHPMALLRHHFPFNRCKKKSELLQQRHGSFIQVAGLVTGRQRPGTAKGTLFLTLEDETGNINVVVWSKTQEAFRQTLLTAKLLVIKGRLEILRENVAQPIIHIIAGQLLDYSPQLNDLPVKSRDFH